MKLIIILSLLFVAPASAADLRIPPLHKVVAAPAPSNQFRDRFYFRIGKTPLPKEKPTDAEPLSKPAGMP